MRMPRRAAAVLLVAAVLSGCTGVNTPMPTPTPTASTAAPTERTGDGVLTIGTLFPSSGDLKFLGPALRAGVDAAVREINAAGGVNGEKVVVVHRDSGDAGAKTAEKSFAELVEKGADVVIGPSSSVLAQRLLGPAAEAGIALISPAATYPQLTLLDDADVFFRTIASYPHQAFPIADLLVADEVATAAIVYREGDLGGSLAAALEAAVADRGIGLTAVPVAADADDDALKAAVAAVKKAKPVTVVLATPDNRADTRTLIRRLVAAGYTGKKLLLTTQNTADYSQSLKAVRMQGVRGLLDGIDPGEAFTAKVRKEDSDVGRVYYAAEAYDATMLAALAAVLAGDDAPAAVRGKLRDPSVGGIKCTTYAECLRVLETQPDIDYDGVSGPVNLDEAGDPTRGAYQVVAYKRGNKYSRTDTVVG